MAMVDVDSCSPAKYLVWMPVRLRIQSSFNSRPFLVASSLLVMGFPGKYLPQPTMWAYGMS